MPIFANGLRAGSGFTVGILGAAVGIHWSLAVSAAAIYALTDRRPAPMPVPEPAAAPEAGQL